MSKRQPTSTGKYDPNAWFPVLKHTLAAGDVGWEQGYRYTIEQADGDLFWFRSAEARDRFCKRHHLQIVDVAAMASVRKEYAFDLTKPWQPGNRLESRKSYAVTRRTLRATKNLPRRSVLKLVEPVSVPMRWSKLLAVRDLGQCAQGGRPAPMWDPLTLPDDHRAHVIDPTPMRLDGRVSRSVIDDFLVEAHLRSDHRRYWLDFRVIQKRCPDDLSFDAAEALYNGGDPLYAIPSQVVLEFTSTEHMHLTIRKTGK
jgi:hypothetical protein